MYVTKIPRMLHCMLRNTRLMYDIMYNKISVYLRVYCHTIFGGDEVNQKLTFSNAKLVLMRLQTGSIKRRESDIYFT